MYGATELADGHILSWAGVETLRLWAAEGTAVGEWPLSQEAPDAVLAGYFEAEGRGALVRCGVPVRTTRGHVSVAGAVWHATAAPGAHAFLEDGTVVVTLASGHVFCLQLHHGARRVTAAEATELARAPRYGQDWHATGEALAVAETAVTQHRGLRRPPPRAFLTEREEANECVRHRLHRPPHTQS